MICRAVLANRSSFAVASDRAAANAADARLLKWLGQIGAEIDAAVSSSSLGTGYEEVLRQEIMNGIGVRAALFDPHLPETMTLAVAK